MESTKALAARLLDHFTFEPGGVPPTLSDFCRQTGLTLSEYSALCENRDFAEAARDARARYLDTLTVGALLKKYDAGFVKYLLDAEKEERDDDNTPEGFCVEVRVLDEA